MHMNSADVLPPIDTPLVIQMPCGRLERAERTRHVESRGRDMEYKLECGRLIVGRFKWTYR